MSDFFHGWRLKLGCVTLLVACGFQIAFIRGLIVEDVFRYDISDGDLIELRLECQAVRLRYAWDMWINVGFEPPSNEFNWVTFPVNAQNPHNPGPSRSLVETSHGSIELSIPNLPAIKILAIAAACLILWKPQNSRLANQPIDS